MSESPSCQFCLKRISFRDKGVIQKKGERNISYGSVSQIVEPSNNQGAIPFAEYPTVIFKTKGLRLNLKFLPEDLKILDQIKGLAGSQMTISGCMHKYTTPSFATKLVLFSVRLETETTS